MTTVNRAENVEFKIEPQLKQDAQALKLIEKKLSSASIAFGLMLPKPAGSICKNASSLGDGREALGKANPTAFCSESTTEALQVTYLCVQQLKDKNDLLSRTRLRKLRPIK